MKKIVLITTLLATINLSATIVSEAKIGDNIVKAQKELLIKNYIPKYEEEKEYIKPIDTTDHKKERKKEIQAKIIKKWIENPIRCFYDISGLTVPKCIKKDKKGLDECQIIAIKKINKICKIPLTLSIAKKYNETHKKNPVKITDKNIPEEFKKELKKEFSQYQRQMYFIIGYTTGYVYANKHIKYIKKKTKEELEKIKKEK